MLVLQNQGPTAKESEKRKTDIGEAVNFPAYSTANAFLILTIAPKRTVELPVAE